MISITQLYELFCQHPIVTTDSRVCPKDSIFFALKGENFNGNQFAAASLQAGCAYAVVDEEEFADNKRILLVDNCLQSLQQLAAHHRMQFPDLPVIGITGTNGKTTTKELTAAVLSQKYKVLYTQGNLNNHIGVPLTLLKITKEHDIAIIEMGANHPGEIAELTVLVQPTHGLITNVGKAHLEGFGSLQGVIDTKTALYRHLQAKGGIVFYNPENQWLAPLATKGMNPLSTRGMNPPATKPANQAIAYTEAKAIENQAYLSIVWQGKSEHRADTQLIGNYNCENLRAAISVGLHFDVEEEAINRALQAYRPTNNRSQWMQSQRNQLIVDAYNANPTSMNAAIDNFLALELHNKAVILGGMRELGTYSEEEHINIVNKLRNSQLTKIILIGNEFCVGEKDERFQLFADVQTCRKALEEAPLNGYTLLVKGSRSNQLEKLIDLL